jgi:hypothetical protein
MLETKRPRLLVLATSAWLVGAAVGNARPAPTPGVREVTLRTPGARALLVETLTLPEPEVRKHLYVTAAVAAENVELDILAGVIAEQATLTPHAAAPQFRRAMNELWTLLRAHTPNPDYDLAGTPERQVTRLLGRIVPLLPPSSRAATHAFARRYATALRAGVDQTRALTRIESLYDQQGMYDQFRREAWERFVDAVRTTQALNTVVNAPPSPFVRTLGLHTTDRPRVMISGRGPRAPRGPRRDLGPLAVFVRDHLQPDGSVVASGTELGVLVGQAGDAATALTRDYAENLFAINRAEEAFLQATQGPPGVSVTRAAAADPKKELEEAIASAKEAQKNLDATLKDIRGGTSGVLGFVSGWFKLAGFEDDAKDVAKLAKAVATILDGVAKYSKAAITVAEKIGKILPLDTTGAAIIGTAVLTGGLAAVAVEVFSIFGSGAPDKMEQVLKTLKEIKEIVTEIKEEMHNRFNRIDDKLNRMLDTIVEYFALVNWEIGETQVQVGEVQAGLYEVQSQLSRLERNVYTFMNALSHQPLHETIAGTLRYRERTGTDMPFTPTYVDAENAFYVWARVLSKDELLGGPLQRSFSDDSLLAELTTFPLATNINYLSQLPQVRFGLPALSTARLSNPLDWGVASESYAQLSEEWPAHAAAIAPFRLADVRDSGQRLATALNSIASEPLFTSLANHYQTSFATVKAEIGAFEASYEQDPTNSLFGADMWGGPDQVPTQSFLSKSWALPWCNGGPIGSVPDLPFTFRHADYLAYGALMLGYNLGAGAPGGCIDGHWSLWSSEPTGLGGTWRYTYRLNVVVRISYGQTRVLAHTFQTPRERQNVRLPSAPFNPNTTWPPAPEVETQWGSIRSRPASVSLTAPTAFMAEVRNGVTAQLVLRQRDFYFRVAQKCRQSGNAIASAVRVLSGSKTLWESYLTLGLPTALEQNDYLRSLVYGNGAVFTGTDVGDDDGLVNDIEDVYIYSSSQQTPPTQNVMVGLAALQAERADNLRDEITRVLEAMELADVNDGEDLVRSTLTRLSVVPQAPSLP